MTESTKPKWELEDAIRRADEALRLAVLHRVALESRLTAGRIDTLRGDLGALQESPADRRAARTAQKGKTGQERDLAADGHDWVMSIRESAKRTRGLSAGTLTALGVGEEVQAKNTSAVRGAIQAILDKLQEAEGLATTLGLLPEDLEEGRQLHASLGGADVAQADAMAAGKSKTFDKNTLQLQVEAAVDEISSRGRMAFRKDKGVRALFEALVSRSGPAPGNNAAGDDPASAGGPAPTP